MSHRGDDSDTSFHRKSFAQAEDRSNQPLRRPRVQSSSDDSQQPFKSVLQRHSRGNVGGQFASPARANPLLKASVLSPDAAEFVPKAPINPPIKPFSMQDRLKKHNLSDKYNNQQNPTEDVPIDNLLIENGVQNMQINEGIKSIVETLETFVINLIRDPGLYHKVQETFISFLNPYLFDPQNNIMIISDTASMLFLHAVDNPNFRYSGARLCITIAERSPEFQANLLLLCDRDINLQTQNMKGLLLFIAELYMNKADDSAIYGNMLFSGFDVLLSTMTEDNVVAACQVIKLTGRKFSADFPSNLDDILHRLEEIKQSMRNNIQSLIESVRKNCELQMEETPPMSGSQEFTIPGMDETNTLPILIGKEGIEVGPDDEFCSGDDDSDLEEMYAQYEEFLKLPK